ncbi:MAG TPA: hypothetical protein VFK52_03335 [Nocardioidaceae bacterium]|nr:hypothetical protein [Nocardioidaceae bacterium]
MRSRLSRPDLLGASATVATILIAMSIPLLFDSGYYWRGDTQAGAYGNWFHIGDTLRNGEFPILDTSAWRAGNLVAEGGWGVFNPVVWVLGLLATVVPSPLVFATAVKFTMSALGSLGVFVLARSYGARTALAYLAGVGSALSGMALWLDWPSWITGTAIWALAPWCWWAIRHTAQGRGPLLSLTLGYLMVSTGYVYGTIMLGVVLIAVFAEGLLLRRRAALAVLGVGVLCALSSVIVYLPSLLTFDVTIRTGQGFALDGPLTSTPRYAVTSFLPTAGADEGFEQQTAWRYTLWFLPLLAFVSWRTVVRGWRAIAAPAVALLITLLMVNGPAVMGPLRWPMRLSPFLAQFAAVFLAIVLSRYPVRVTWKRVAFTSVWIVAAAVWYAVRQHSLALEHLTGGVVVLVAVLGLAFLLRRHGVLAVAAGGAASVGILALQVVWWTEPPSDQRHLPTTLDGYRTQLTSARGDAMVIGQVNRIIDDPALAEEVLAGTAWYLTGKSVQNTYTTISYKAYYDRYCIRIHGQTCPEALDTLFSAEPTTGVLRVDLLDVSTLLLIKADVGSPPVPPGWYVAEETSRTVTWVRHEPLPTAGGPVWSSPGTRIYPVSNTDREVTIQVSTVPPEGGTVVFSRLDWPGYSTSAGDFDDPTDDYLLTLDIDDETVGKTVTVRFDPPAWNLGLLCLAASLVGGATWGAAATWSRRRSR